MASAKKQIQQLAKQFLKLSLADGVLSAERVGGILAYIEKHRPAHTVAVLKAYQRLVAAEVARGQALIEHAGPISPAVLASIEADMTKKYGRKVAAVTRPNDKLLAGFRIRVGDDIYESSVAGQLATLAGAL
jgi:F-type H+-transporting ATPase subunit delta